MAKALKAPKGAKRELLDVDVKFVSIVRKPANRSPFSVVKSADSNQEILYKSEDWNPDPEEPGLGSRLFAVLLKALGKGPKEVTESNGNGDPQEAVAEIDGLGNDIGAAFKEAEMAVDKKEIDALKKQAADLLKRIESAEAEVTAKEIDALDGIDKESSPTLVAERLGAVLQKLEAEVEKAGEEKKGKLKKLLGGIAEKLAGALKGIPEEMRSVKEVKASDAAPTGKGSAGPGEHMDANQTGVFDDAMDPKTEEAMKAKFADIIKESEERHAKEMKALKAEIDGLKKKAGLSTIDPIESASGGDDPTEKTHTTSAWKEDMAGEFNDEEMVAALKGDAEFDFGPDPVIED